MTCLTCLQKCLKSRKVFFLYTALTVFSLYIFPVSAFAKIEAYSEPSQTTERKLFAKVVKGF